MAILELYEQGQITEETALLYCTSKGVTSRGIDKIKKLKGQQTTDIGGLTLDSSIHAGLTSARAAWSGKPATAVPGPGVTAFPRVLRALSPVTETIHT